MDFLQTIELLNLLMKKSKFENGTPKLEPNSFFPVMLFVLLSAFDQLKPIATVNGLTYL